MSWYGVDAVDDAIDVTREFLFPFSVGRWVRMAVVSLFTSGGGGAGQIASNAGNIGARLAGSAGFSGVPGGAGAWAALLVSLPTVLVGGTVAGRSPRSIGGVLQAEPIPEAGAVGALGTAVLLAILVLVIVAILLPPIFEFVLVDAIASDDLGILRDAGSHLTNGIRLLGFRIGLFVAFVAPPAAVVAAVVLSNTQMRPLMNNVPVIVALALAVLIYVLVFAFIDRFTVEFVVPAMVADGGGVIDGWRRVWPRLRGQLRQTVVYIVMHWLVGIGISIVSVVLALVGLLAVGAAAAGIGFVVGTVTSGAASTDLGVGLGVLAGIAVGVPIFIVAVLLPIQVLTVTYRRAYELAALGRFADSLDLVARYRDDDGSAAVRDADGDGGDGSGPAAEVGAAGVDGSETDASDSGTGDGEPDAGDDDAGTADEDSRPEDDGSDPTDRGDDMSTPDEFGGFVPASSEVDESADQADLSDDSEGDDRDEGE
jgi:hypothetical protein